MLGPAVGRACHELRCAACSSMCLVPRETATIAAFPAEGYIEAVESCAMGQSRLVCWEGPREASRAVRT